MLTSQPASLESPSGKYNMETSEKTDIKGGSSVYEKNRGYNTKDRHAGTAVPDSGRMAQARFSPNFDSGEVFSSNVEGNQLSPKSQNKHFTHSNKQNLEEEEEEDDDEDGVDPQNVPRPAHLKDETLHAVSDMPTLHAVNDSTKGLDFNDSQKKSNIFPNSESMKGVQYNENMPAKQPDPPKTTVPGYGLKKDTDYSKENARYRNDPVDSPPTNATETSKTDTTPKTTVPGYGLKKDANYSKSDPSVKTSESQSRATKSGGKGGHRHVEKGPTLKYVAAAYMPQDTSVPRFGFEGFGFRRKSASGPASPTNEKSFFARRMSFGKSDSKEQDSETADFAEPAAGTAGMETSRKEKSSVTSTEYSDRTKMGSTSSGSETKSRRSSTGSAGRKSKHKLYPSRRAAVDDQPAGLSPDQLTTSGRKLERSLSIGSEDAGVYAKTVGNMPSLIDPSVPTYGHKEVTETSVYSNDNGGDYKMHSKDTAVGRKVSVGSHGSANDEGDTPQFQEIHEHEVEYSYDPTTVPRSQIEHEGKDTSETEKKLGVFGRIRRTLSNHTES